MGTEPQPAARVATSCIASVKGSFAVALTMAEEEGREQRRGSKPLDPADKHGGTALISGHRRMHAPEQRQDLLRSIPSDYDTITRQPEVNGLVEPLTDPYVRLHIYADVLLTETKY